MRRLADLTFSIRQCPATVAGRFGALRVTQINVITGVSLYSYCGNHEAHRASHTKNDQRIEQASGVDTARGIDAGWDE